MSGRQQEEIAKISDPDEIPPIANGAKRQRPAAPGGAQQSAEIARGTGTVDEGRANDRQFEADTPT